MMSYWAEFAHSGNPGRGRDGEEVPWTAWAQSSERGNKFIIFDTEAGGGIRMSPDEPLTRELVIAGVAADSRLRGELRARCEIYYSFVEWGHDLSQTEYEQIEGGACGAEYPFDAFPWKS
jgi:para-nitrobenzyl esterase